MLNKFDIAIIFPNNMLVICVYWNRSIDTNWMLSFTHLNAFDDTKNVAVKIYTILITGEYKEDRGRELLDTLIMEEASAEASKFQQKLPKSFKAKLNKIRID